MLPVASEGELTLEVILSRVSCSTQPGLSARQFFHKGAAMEDDLVDSLL